jgi:hypothetical protein
VGRENRGKKHGGGGSLQDGQNGKETKTKLKKESRERQERRKRKMAGKGCRKEGGLSSILEGNIFFLGGCFTKGMRELWSSLFVVYK